MGPLPECLASLPNEFCPNWTWPQGRPGVYRLGKTRRKGASTYRIMGKPSSMLSADLTVWLLWDYPHFNEQPLIDF